VGIDRKTQIRKQIAANFNNNKQKQKQMRTEQENKQTKKEKERKKAPSPTSISSPTSTTYLHDGQQVGDVLARRIDLQWTGLEDGLNRLGQQLDLLLVLHEKVQLTC
jgi:hypothetical protein